MSERGDSPPDPTTIRNDQPPSAVEHDAERDGVVEPRYRSKGQLGAGAMGEVRLCEDLRIGREVAFKVVRSGPPDASIRKRFLQEARIQAQLEHPSIVPVYDIGRDEAGAPFFTMKRVRGLTLRQVIESLRRRDAAAEAKYSRRRLLAAFTTICLTLDYAHEHEVIHRDLKPSNIMLGDFGELYVLDWGIARSASPTEDTASGIIVGTRGYMAPEQARGEPLDARADVYSLGAILFEILTLERLHTGEARADDRPSSRAPRREIPPELDAICMRATAFAAADRFPSARALYEAVDRFLEGDRDLERRRELSQQHTASARALAENALSAGASEAESTGRTQAMAEVSRALAFDPSNVEARRVLFRLLTDPPRTLPQEVKDELARYYHRQQRGTGRGGALLYLMFFFWAPIMLFVGDHHAAWYFGLSAVLFASAAAALLRASRRPLERRASGYAGIVLTSLALSSLSASAGPLVLVPSLVMANQIGFLLRPNRARRGAIIAISFAAVAVPQLLDWLGVVPPAYVVANGRTTIMNRLMDFTPTAHGFFVAITLALVLAVGIYFSRFRDMLTEAEERLFVLAWQLRKLAPDR